MKNKIRELRFIFDHFYVLYSVFKVCNSGTFWVVCTCYYFKSDMKYLTDNVLKFGNAVSLSNLK